ncbi:hypothetical protein [Bernardetia sp.]|uniref:hypothetical protein n=1 Tax=Bernardetia sp. TaxID=1937974 RepID=UPI0025C299A2|nr:hypothetical protein [Bernardetia sp.]
MNNEISQGQRIFDYIHTEIELITQKSKRYPLPYPNMLSDVEIHFYMKQADRYKIEYELLFRIKRIIETAFSEKNDPVALKKYIKEELDILKEKQEGHPIPSPPFYKGNELEEYLKKVERVDIECELLSRVEAVIRNIIA